MNRIAPCNAVTTAMLRRRDIAATGMLHSAYHGKVKPATIAYEARARAIGAARSDVSRYLRAISTMMSTAATKPNVDAVPDEIRPPVTTSRHGDAREMMPCVACAADENDAGATT